MNRNFTFKVPVEFQKALKEEKFRLYFILIVEITPRYRSTIN